MFKGDFPYLNNVAHLLSKNTEDKNQSKFFVEFQSDKFWKFLDAFWEHLISKIFRHSIQKQQYKVKINITTLIQRYFLWYLWSSAT